MSLFERIKEKINKGKFREIDFSKPISESDKRYLATLDPKIKEMYRHQALLTETDTPKVLPKLSLKQMERVKSDLRDDKYNKIMLNMEIERLKQKKKILDPDEFKDMENYFRNYKIDENQIQSGSGFRDKCVFPDKFMIKFMKKLNKNDIKMLCKFDKNVKIWCKKHNY